MAEAATKEQKLSRLESKLKELKSKHNEVKIKKEKKGADYDLMRFYKIRIKRVKGIIRNMKNQKPKTVPPVVVSDAFREKKVKQLEESLAIFKSQATKLKEKGPADPLFRKVRRKLRRVARRLSILKPVTIEERLPLVKKQIEALNGRLEALKKKGKKPGNAYFNALSSKVKSLSKKVKKFTKIIEKKKAAAPAAPAQS